MASLILSGSTSGSVTLSSPAVSGTTTLTLPTTSGTVLTSGTNTNFPAGSVLQVVNATFSTITSINSGSYTDTGLTVSITPKSATNKILITAFLSVSKGATDSQGYFRLNRNSTGILNFEQSAPYTATSTRNSIGAIGTTYLDSPATTSSTVYKVQMFTSGAVSLNDNTGACTITVMEIAA